MAEPFQDQCRQQNDQGGRPQLDAQHGVGDPKDDLINGIDGRKGNEYAQQDCKVFSACMDQVFRVHPRKANKSLSFGKDTFVENIKGGDTAAGKQGFYFLHG